MPVGPTVHTSTGIWLVASPRGAEMRRSWTVAVIGVAVIGMQPAVAHAAPASASYIVVLRDADADPGASASAETRRHGGAVATVYDQVGAYAAVMTAGQAASTAADPAVQYVAPNHTFRHDHEGRRSQDCRSRNTGSPSSAPTSQCLPQSIDRIDGEASSTRSGDHRGSVPVNIGVIDSGVDRNTQDLNLAGGIDCSSGSPVQSQSAFIDAEAVYGGHGTPVAGAAAAVDNDRGVVGSAPGAGIWSLRVEDDNGDLEESSIICGINYAARSMRDSDPRNDIPVANISLGDSDGRSDDQRCGLVNHDPFHTAICRGTRRGVLYVASAMNDSSPFTTTVPAAYDEVLTVTGMNDYDGRPGAAGAAECFGFDASQDGADDAAAEFSDWAEAADVRHTVAASATCVPTLFPEPAGTHVEGYDGTSFAAPTVAGVAALCIADGRCRAGQPQRTMDTLISDAAAYNRAHRQYGFHGDPLRPVPGRYYGFLVRAGDF
jgi:subtilisin